MPFAALSEIEKELDRDIVREAVSVFQDMAEEIGLSVAHSCLPQSREQQQALMSSAAAKQQKQLRTAPMTPREGGGRRGDERTPGGYRRQSIDIEGSAVGIQLRRNGTKTSRPLSVRFTLFFLNMLL